MAAKLKLAAKNLLLGLLLKSFIAVLGAYLFRRTGGAIGWLFLLILSFWSIYFRPFFNSRKFLASALALFSLIILIPKVGGRFEFILLLAWGGAFFIFLGVKNLLFLRRQINYEVLHLTLITGLGVLFLIGFIPQVVFFLILFFLFREFYFAFAPYYPQRLTLIAAAEALLILEIAWVMSFVSIHFLTGAVFLALMVFIFHDLIFHHLTGALSRRLILRNITLFVGLSLVLILTPS